MRCNTDHLTVVIVLNIGNRVVGVVVDGCRTCSRWSHLNCAPCPRWTQLDPDHLLAIGSAVDERMLILLDIEKFWSDTDAGESTVGAH